MADKTYTRQMLINDIERDVKCGYKSGVKNNLTDVGLSIVLTASSLAAAVLLSVNHKSVSPWMIAAVAAIPAACRTLQSIVDFRRRSNWYFSYTDALQQLVLELKYDDAADLKQYAVRLGNLEVEHGKVWTQVTSGSPPVGDTSHRLLNTSS